MRHAAIALLVLGVGCGASSPANGRDGGAPDASVSSDAAVDDDASGPDDAAMSGDGAIDPSGLTTMKVHYPAGAHTLSVRGAASPLDWNAGMSMSAGSDDTWTVQITLPATTPTLEWKPLIDDSTWSIGANYTVARGATVDIYPRFYTQNGTVEQLFPAFTSTNLGNTRVVWAYLPPSYSENTRATYPVLYMQDGQNLFSTGVLGTGGWQVDATLNQAGQDGTIREIIVIAPEHAGVKREYEYTPTVDPSEMDGGGADKYLAFLISELKPQVDQMLRTQPGVDTTGNLGSSLGGVLSIYAGYKQAATFGIIGAMSPSTWWDNEVLTKDVLLTGPTRPKLIYVDCGTDDTGTDEDDLDETQKLVNAYVKVGYVKGANLMQVIADGDQHGEQWWAKRLPVALQFLFGPR